MSTTCSGIFFIIIIISVAPLHAWLATCLFLHQRPMLLMHDKKMTLCVCPFIRAEEVPLSLRLIFFVFSLNEENYGK